LTWRANNKPLRWLRPHPSPWAPTNDSCKFTRDDDFILTPSSYSSTRENNHNPKYVWGKRRLSNLHSKTPGTIQQVNNFSEMISVESRRSTWIIITTTTRANGTWWKMRLEQLGHSWSTGLDSESIENLSAKTTNCSTASHLTTEPEPSNEKNLFQLGGGWRMKRGGGGWGEFLKSFF
jgi:ribonuclease D